MTDDERRIEKNAQLAVLLGWVITEEPDDWYLHDPAGKLVYQIHSAKYGRISVAAHVPDFYGSADACLAVLPADMHVTIQPRFVQRRITYFVTLMSLLAVSNDLHYGDGSTRAEALALAVESWTTSRREGV